MVAKSFPRTERRQTLLAVCIALTAGYLDAYALLKLGVFISFMSGNTTMAALRIGEGHISSALAPALAIPCFVVGSFAGTCVTTYPKAYAHRLLFLIGANLLIIVAVLAPLESLKLVGIAVLAVATGLLNHALSHIGSESVSLTFVTGTLSRIGSHLGLGIRVVPPPGAEGPWDSHFHRARLGFCTWGGFFTGAVVSGILMNHAPHFALPLAIVGMVALAAFGPNTDVRSP